MEEVAAAIARASRESDPEEKGINIVVPGSPLTDGDTGLPIPGTEDTDIRDVTVRILPSIRDVTLRNLLEIVVQTSNRPIKYTVEDWGILFSARRPGDLPPLHTRWFKVDSNTFMARLEQRLPASAVQTSKPDKMDLDLIVESQLRPGEPDTVIAKIKRYFGSVGVHFAPPRAIVFSETRGMLMVRATLQDLDIIEQAVHALNAVPPQVVIEARFYEVPEELVASGGLQLTLDAPDTNAVRFALNVLNVSAENSTFILPPQQYAAVRRALEQKP